MAVLCMVILLPSSVVLLATMVNASAARLAVWRHVVPLILQYDETKEYNIVSLSCYVDIGPDMKEKHKFNVPFMNSQDVETLCHCVLKFDDVAALQCLSITTGPLKFSFF